VLALFSPLVAAKQPDWPQQTQITGFPFLDGDGSAPLSSEVVDFLNAGPPPVVFTLGSSSAIDAGRFFQDSAAAIQRLKRRAVLVVGGDPSNRPGTLPEGVVAVSYAPFAELFPRAAAIVHSGGIGTTALAMRAGRPMLVVPFSHDQPDNAARVTRLGIARTISRRRFSPKRVAAELKQILETPSYSAKAAEVGEKVRMEDGVAAACDALEAHGQTR
jgi:UDP:flavonoid glycosyltransferase YjiC (YdhE family)